MAAMNIDTIGVQTPYKNDGVCRTRVSYPVYGPTGMDEVGLEGKTDLIAQTRLD